MAKLLPFSENQVQKYKESLQLPSSWYVEAAHFAFDEVRDGTHDTPTPVEQGIRLVTSKNLKSFGIDFSDTLFISDHDYLEISKRSKVKKGDILFSMIGTIGNVALVETDVNFSIKNVALFRSKPSAIHSRFAKYWLQSKRFQVYLEGLKRGGNQKFVSLGVLREAPIPLPPLAEQQEIATRLDNLLAQVDTIKARLDAIPAILKRFRQSVLAAAVSGKLTEDWRLQFQESQANWSKLTFADICKEITVGFVGKMSDQYQEHGVPFLRSQNVRAFNFSSINLLYISEQFHKELHKSRLEAGDLAIVRSGAPGTTCVIPDSLGEANCSDLVIARPKETLNSAFGCIYMNSEIAQKNVAANQVGVAQQHFNVGSMKKMPIHLPSLPEQTEIVRRVEQLFAFADQIEQQVQSAQSRVNHLTQAILAKAFKGELTADWRAANPELISGENSAQALLDKIKASPTPSKPKRSKAQQAELF